jgi:hypothetical protein
MRRIGAPFPTTAEAVVVRSLLPVPETKELITNPDFFSRLLPKIVP